jgi:uncharacterized protein
MARAQVEKIICSDSDLNADDDAMTELFKIPKEYHLEYDNSLYVEQRAWLKNIRNACTAKPCLHVVYQERIKYLKNAIYRQFPDSLKKLGPDAQCKLTLPVEIKSECETVFDCAENSDHSFLQALSSNCKNKDAENVQEVDRRNVSVYLYQKMKDKPILLKQLVVEIGDEDIIAISWQKSDYDGFPALEIETSCGMHSCFGEVFRFDPVSKEMYHFYSGELRDVQYFDGFLLEGEKIPCCLYKITARRILRNGSRYLLENKRFTIESTIDAKPSCHVYEHFGKDDLYNRLVKLPSKKWLKFCPTADYGE